MSIPKEGVNISWSNFESCNPNKREAFENLCRCLFNAFFFSGKALFHSDPNNPGIEVLPIYHPESKKRISFQAKYFSTISYSQIKESAEKAIKYYAGDLDVIYLYCNKDIDTQSKAYCKVVELLQEKKIEIIPITNQTILEQVIKDETLSWYYFNNFMLTNKWFREKLECSISLLGPRYNRNLNIETYAENNFNYFLRNQQAVEQINKQKTEQIENLKSELYRYEENKKIVAKIAQEASLLEDITLHNIESCLAWEKRLISCCEKEFAYLSDILHNNKELLSSEQDKTKRRELSNEISSIERVLCFPTSISPNVHEKRLMSDQVLIVKGNAGVGKSQMLASVADNMVANGLGTVLLIGESFLNNNYIDKQIPEVLSIDISLEALLHKLEGFGIVNQSFSYIFIDGINESTYREIWKSGLSLLFAQISKFPHVKLVLSVRSGYECLVFDENIQKNISDGKIATIVHNGFSEDSISKINQFLNYYNIPFLPTYILQSEMNNPLFLSLYCKTYCGENYDMFTMFDKIIDLADKEAQKAVNITEQTPVLRNLIDEMVAYYLDNHSFGISKVELFKLSFWDIYGLSSKKIPFISSLLNSGLLISYISSESEIYFLSYNLLENFVCAKYILKKYSTKNDLIGYIVEDLLSIEDGRLNCNHYGNIDTFIVLSGLYAQKYNEECIDDIIELVTDDIDKNRITEKYLNSFLWRKASSINSMHFKDFINKHSVNKNTVLNILVENSIKEKHPLNALFLQSILQSKTISERDSIWTTYINELAYDDERLYELVNFFEEGKTMDGLSEENIELLLILFIWLFSSSNRFLRDKASKATIELLKYDISYCEKMLNYFSDVNDPYIIQRLYGVVFGACVNRKYEDKNKYRSLVIYIYSHVFDQELIYPDILLRDYARLIIERWCYEYPTDCDFFDYQKIKPPYKSIDIPIVEKQEYYDSTNQNRGFNMIDFSMMIDHKDVRGIYGDFGRYVFQSALNSFEDIDIVNLYHYAMQYIRDELKYDNYLDYYDCSSFHENYRSETKKKERIGKKYEWIAYYNILARVSDRYKIKKWDDTTADYNGPWDPYVRDFDPTLNTKIIKNDGIPCFALAQPAVEFLSQDSSYDTDTISNWVSEKPTLFSEMHNQLLLIDSSGSKWAVLHNFADYKHRSDMFDSYQSIFNNGNQSIWYMAQSYFISKEQVSILKENEKQFLQKKDIFYNDVYQLFNKEYGWSPGYDDMLNDSDDIIEIDNGKYHTVVETIKSPDFEHWTPDKNGNMKLKFIEKKFKKQVPDSTTTIQFTPSCSVLNWSEEYDASQNDSISYFIPCKKLFENLHLEQKSEPGKYFTQNGELICFDGSVTGLCDGLMFRLDYLKTFLKENNMEMFWVFKGEKQFFKGEMSQEWSEWRGLLSLNNDSIEGEIKQFEHKN